MKEPQTVAQGLMFMVSQILKILELKEKGCKRAWRLAVPGKKELLYTKVMNIMGNKHKPHYLEKLLVRKEKISQSPIPNRNSDQIGSYVFLIF